MIRRTALLWLLSMMARSRQLAALGLGEMEARALGGSAGPPLVPAGPAAQAPAEPPAQVPEASPGASFEEARPFDYEPGPTEQAGDDDGGEEDRLGLLETCHYHVFSGSEFAFFLFITMLYLCWFSLCLALWSGMHG